MMNVRLLSRLAVAAILLFVSQNFALACPVCFGAEGDPATNGMNLAILTLLGVTGSVLAGFLSFFLRLRRRAQIGANEGGDA